ncbi:hypothetical protein [Microcystis phage Mel-JY33]
MSTLTVTDIRRTGETVSRSTRGIAAAWVHFNGTGTVAVGDSENTSSITDIRAGTYAQNFTSSFADAVFSSVGTGTDNVNGYQIGVSNYARLAGSTSMRGQSSNHAGYDSIFTSYVSHGDLA